jgi:serine/threonine protein kinase/Flp pilus assembly protein TadD
MASTFRIGQSLTHYRILEQIGAGGMGVVFRARDERLEREVAIKVLPSGALASEVMRKRFHREALTLSKLNHPNVASIYDFDSHERIDFLVMELVGGVPLNEKLRTAALSENEVLRLGSQIAAGMAAAHVLGIIHCDLKPGNLRLLPDGRLKILDFGLARLLHSSAASAEPETLSQPYAPSGTLPYMAPEQVVGDALDVRTDIHAIGAVLYELATGQRSFSESQSALLIDAILHRSPVPPRLANPRISPELERIILKCLDKAPENRYQSASELEIDLRRALPVAAQTTTTLAGRYQKSMATRVVGGFAIIALATVAVLSLGRLLKNPASSVSEPPITSLAVLPLTNISGDPAQEYFADGMTEELTTEMAQIGALRVTSRTSVMLYKNAHKPLPQIARELHVNALVEGSVLRSGNRVRINAQLINAASDKHLWAESYDRDLGDVLGLQKEVAREIAHQIHVKLTPREESQPGGRHAVDADTHDLYLQGRYRLNKQTEADLDAAIDYFQRAIARDSHFALAYCGLSDAYSSLATFYRAPREVMPEAKDAARKAIQLDDSLSEAHASLGNSYFLYDWDWPAAETELRRAIALNPSNANAHDVLAVYLISMGRTDEGLTEFQRAFQLDPFSLSIIGDRIFFSAMARRYDVAIQNGRDAIATQPENAYARSGLALALALTRRFPEAITEADAAHHLDASPLIASFRASVYAIAGRKAAAERALSEIQEQMKTRYSCSYEVAAVYVSLGQVSRAFDWFEKGYAARSDCMPSFKIDPRFDSIRGHPHYQDLLRRLRLPQ